MARGVGAAKAGCGAFGLVGVLVAVGLTVWLAGQLFATEAEVLDPGDGPAAVGTADPASADGPATGLEVSLDPGTELTEGALVRVTSTAFPAGAAVTVRQCLTPAAGVGLVLGGESSCSAEGAVTAAVGDDGELAVEVPVRVVLTVGGLPFDCSDGDRCSLVVSTEGPNAVSGGAALRFAEGVRPVITLPGD